MDKVRLYFKKENILKVTLITNYLEQSVIIVLAIAILGGLGTLVYKVISPEVGE